MAHDVDDFCAKLLASAQDAAFLSAKVACLAEQTARGDKLVLSETGMKSMYHKLIEKRTASTTHKVDQYTEMVGKAIVLVQKFQGIENQATALTKHLGGKRKKPKKA